MRVKYDVEPISWYKRYMTLAKLGKVDVGQIVTNHSYSIGSHEFEYHMRFYVSESQDIFRFVFSAENENVIEDMRELNREVFDFVALIPYEYSVDFFWHRCSVCGSFFTNPNHRVKDTNICKSCSIGTGQRCNSYIYLIRNTETGLLKLGFSTNPDKRIKQLSTGSDGKLEILYVANGTMKDEKNLHNEFSYLRKRGEWFNFSNDIIDRFELLSRAKNL